MSERKRVSLTIRGLDEDGGDVRLEYFIQQLELLKKALTETQKVMGAKGDFQFKVVELRHQSPAYIAVEPAVEGFEQLGVANASVDKFFRSLDEIERGEHPDGFTFDTFEAYKNLTSLRKKNKVSQLIISPNGSKPKELEQLSSQIDEIVGQDEYEMGAFEGMLEAINVHANQNVFYLYPTSGHPKLKCRFPQALRETALVAVGKYVNVFGEKKYKPNLKFYYPYEIGVHEIEVYPHEETLPKLSELRGIAPDMTGDQKSEDYIRRLRDEWD